MTTTAVYTWESFVHECNTMAQNIDNFESLINNITNKIQQISFEDADLNTLFEELQKDNTDSYKTYLSLDNSDCRIMLILLQSDTNIGLHNHPNQSGFLYCFQGSVHIEAYDEQSSSETTAILEQIYTKTLHRGSYAFLLPDYANIHSLHARTKAMLIDVFIPPPQLEYQHLNRRYKRTESIPNTTCYHAIIVPKS